MQEIKELRDAEFTLDKMDNKLVCMTLLRAPPDKYSSYASSLKMMDKLEKAEIQRAFVVPALPLPSLASSARSQVTPSPPAIATALPKSLQRRTRRTGPRSDAKTAPEVAKALPTPLLNRTPLLLLLQCRNSLVKQVFVPTRPSTPLSTLLTHSGLQTQVPLLI